MTARAATLAGYGVPGRQCSRAGNSAAVRVWENTRAAPFASAVRRSGGQLVASGRIPIQAILAAIQADDAAEGDEVTWASPNDARAAPR